MTYDELYEYVKSFKFYDEDDGHYHIWKHHSVFDNTHMLYYGSLVDKEIYQRLLPYYSDDKILIEEIPLQTPEYESNGIKYTDRIIDPTAISLTERIEFLLNNLPEHKELIIDDNTIIAINIVRGKASEHQFASTYNAYNLLYHLEALKKFDNTKVNYYSIECEYQKNKIVVGTEREIQLYIILFKSINFECNITATIIDLSKCSNNEQYNKIKSIPQALKDLQIKQFDIDYDDWYFEIIK